LKLKQVFEDSNIAQVFHVRWAPIVLVWSHEGSLFLPSISVIKAQTVALMIQMGKPRQTKKPKKKKET
jgi:hypothetical protein